MDWRKKMRNIPAKVQIAPKISYDIVWQKEIKNTKGNELCGTADYDNRIITLSLNLSPKLTVITYIHECLHCFSNEFGLNLTENQILAMEKTFPYIDKLFDKKGSK